MGGGTPYLAAGMFPVFALALVEQVNTNPCLLEVMDG